MSVFAGGGPGVSKISAGFLFVFQHRGKPLLPVALRQDIDSLVTVGMCVIAVLKA